MATSLKHTIAEIEGQTNQFADLDKIEIPKDILPEERKTEVEHNVLFKLIKKKKGRLYLDNCCDNVPNPKNNNIPERIWLLNGAHSIWDSELENILKDKARYERSRRGRDIIFIDGICRVRSSDVMMLEFMRKNRHNRGKNRSGAGPLDFYEYDLMEETKERHAKQLFKIEMIGKVKDMPVEPMKKLASFLGITFNDQELGMPKGDEAIRTELMLKTDIDPATVQKYMNSKEVEVSYLVKRAIIEAKIDLTGQQGNAIWAKGGGFIAKIPGGRKPYEYLTELAMTNSDDGKRFKEQLETQIT